MAAAAAGFESVITLLLLDRPVGEPRGRLLFARDHKGKTALDWAEAKGHSQIATILRSAETQRKEAGSAAKAQAAEPRQALAALDSNAAPAALSAQPPACAAPFPSVDAWLTSIKLGKYAAAIKQAVRRLLLLTCALDLCSNSLAFCAGLRRG